MGSNNESNSFCYRVSKLYNAIDCVSASGIPEEEAKKIAVSLIDVLAEHHLTYDQAHRIIEIAHKTLDVKASALIL